MNIKSRWDEQNLAARQSFISWPLVCSGTVVKSQRALSFRLASAGLSLCLRYPLLEKCDFCGYPITETENSTPFIKRLWVLYLSEYLLYLSVSCDTFVSRGVILWINLGLAIRGCKLETDFLNRLVLTLTWHQLSIDMPSCCMVHH